MNNRPRIFHHLLLLLLAALFLAPFGWMVSTSLKVEDRIFAAPGEAPEQNGSNFNWRSTLTVHTAKA